MPDLTAIIQASSAHAWLYLPVAVILGALHALEPGHAKSLMAAYIVNIRGTAGQAALLGLSAATGHTIVVWALAILGLLLGDALIVERAEPWLTLISGILIVLLAARMLRALWRGSGHGHAHEHPHSHDRQHGGVKPSEIVWFGFTGGLLPCPSAIAVLLICLQLRQFTLGVAMVAAFSVGLAVTLVGIGVAAAWGVRKASKHPWLDRAAARLPLISAVIVMLVGLTMTAFGAAGIVTARRPQ